MKRNQTTAMSKNERAALAAAQVTILASALAVAFQNKLGLGPWINLVAIGLVTAALAVTLVVYSRMKRY